MDLALAYRSGVYDEIRTEAMSHPGPAPCTSSSLTTASLILIEEALATFSEQVTVATYQSGQDALKALQSPKTVGPDLVHITLPNMRGFGVLWVLKAGEQLNLIPLVMLTTSDTAHEVA